MARETQGIAPGWYKDPADPTVQRWWDGEGWLGAPLPADATPPPGPPPPAPADARPAGIPPAGDAVGVPPGSAIPPDSPRGVPPGEAIPPGHPTRPEAPPPAGPQARTAPARPHGYPLATIGARVVARLVDLALILGLNLVANGWFLYQLLVELWRIGEQMTILSSEDQPDTGDAQRLMFIIVVIAAAVWFAYEVPAVANNGQTPGKRLLGIRVMRLESGEPLGLRRSFRRWSFIGLPTLMWTCGLGFLLQLLVVAPVFYDRPLQQGWHDKFTHTVVVNIQPRNRPPVRKEVADGTPDQS